MVFSKRTRRTIGALLATGTVVATSAIAIHAQAAAPAPASPAAAAGSGASSFLAGIPSALRVRALAERRFDAASGLRATTVFAMALDDMGIPWLAADDGIYRYVGGLWRRDPVLREFDYQQVRSLWFSADGTAWLGTRRGLIRRPANGTPAVYRERNGLPGAVIYSLAESKAIDGTARVVAGASTGAAWFNGATFVPMALPEVGNPWVGVMVASGVGTDGTPTLWAANSAGGVGRYARGVWSGFSRTAGLTAPDAQFVLPITRGALRGVYVATSVGVFVAPTDAPDARFTLIAGSPRGVYRLALVPEIDGQDELWVGTSDGSLWRWRPSGWTRVESTVSTRRGTVTLLQPFPTQAGETAIYASARNGSLVRITNGVAASVDFTAQSLAPVVTSVAVAARPDRADHLWIATQDDGLVEVPPAGPIRVHPFRAGSPNGVVSLVRRDVVSAPTATPGSDTVTLAIAAGVPWRQQGDAFVPFGAGLAGAVFDVRRVRMPNGLFTLVAGTERGVRQWSGSAWTPVPGVEAELSGALLDGTLGGEPVLYIGAVHAVRVFGRNGLRVDSLPGPTSQSTARGVVTRLCRTRTATGQRLFALDPERGVYWRDEQPGASWRAFPGNPVIALANTGALNLRCLPQGEVAVSSFTGLAVFDVAAADTAAWRVRTSVSDADGLPSVLVSDVVAGGSQRLWAATPYGLGVVDRTRAEAAPTGRVMLHVSVGATEQTLADGAVLAEPTMTSTSIRSCSRFTARSRLASASA
ncbi:MAG: hypothetical protein K2R93_16250 [Gemmatimonadaceae bacterium]|nr:hypothetical protein [Gemmatimonadaceae bacterium]